MEELNRLNEMGRNKITQLRDEIENMELYARETADDKLLVEVESQRHQLASIIRTFKDANISSMLAIEKAEREDLLKSHDTDENGIRQRKKVDRTGLLKMSSGVTEQLLSISRQLADTTQRSQDTLDNLVSSSTTVHLPPRKSVPRISCTVTSENGFAAVCEYNDGQPSMIRLVFTTGKFIKLLIKIWGKPSESVAAASDLPRALRVCCNPRN
ncbi:Vesicle transport protein SEC20 [Eumeta japonica]|uniref:Vesicle transport protein SEC20 n=1 Tax=Eumeta variegata TaxID=151549 RepID=A0A4C1YMT6_EUMVA|nr:Vesicle transport protein SEC20 [Eumeta japonica]